MNQFLKELLEESQRLVAFLGEQSYGYKCPPDLRNRYAIAHFYIVLDWHIAIVVLAQNKIYGPAITLIRPMLEMSTRGAWLVTAASDEEIDRLTSNNDVWREQRFRDFPRLVGEIKPHNHAVGEILEWNWAPRQFLHDCVHGNNRYINFYFHGPSGTIEPNVPNGPRIGGLNLANNLALTAAVQMTSCAQDGRRAELIAKKQLEYMEYANTLSERMADAGDDEEGG